ncbi:MAG: sensor histidine kinase [Myxococcota bacterium]
MSAPRINYVEIFEELSHPVGMCDADGNLLLLSRAAREFLGVDSCEDVSLDLAGRDTFSELRISGLTSREYYLADVPIRDAQLDTVSVTLTPLSSGDFQIVLHESGVSDEANPSVELLRNLCSFEPHVTLFRTVEELVGLYASAFRDVFSDYCFAISVETERFGTIEHVRTTERVDTSRDVEVDLDGGSGPVDSRDLLWSGSMVGHRVPFSLDGRGRGCLQVESTSFRGFQKDHIPAFEAFARQLAEEVARRQGDSRGLEHDLLAPVLDGLSAMVVVCDEHRRVRACNEAFESVVSRGTDDVLGRDLLDLVSESDRSPLRVAAASAIAGESPAPLEISVDTDETLRIQVSPLRERESARRLSRPRGFLVYSRAQDVTLAEIEQRIERAEHLMTLGQLATGVAHELKNPLTSILNYAEYLLHKYDDEFFEVDDRDRLKRIVNGVERMDHFVRDLLQLARPDQGDIRAVDLRKSVQRALQVVRMSLDGQQVELNAVLPDSRVEIQGMSGQLEQLFVNLVNNAVNAMGDDTGFVRVEIDEADGQIVCRVIDNAGGMSEDTVSRIFEPFFTTRGSTNGTGLGLALVRVIVDRHHGEIDVDSEVGQGTTFTVEFPAKREES